MKDVLYPEVQAKIIGENGNIFNLMAIVIRAMRMARVPKKDITRFTDEVMASNSYEEALAVIMRWVTVT